MTGSPNGSEEDRSSHPVPPPFNPMPSHASMSHHTLDSAHAVVHSVVPDLMQVYESLTKGNTNVSHYPPQELEQHCHLAQRQQQQEAEYLHQKQQHQQEHPQQQEPRSQQVNYSFIQSEEQYHQIYREQGGSDQQQASYQPPPVKSQGQQASSLPFIPPPLSQDVIAQAQRPTSTAPSEGSIKDDSSIASSKSSRRKRSNSRQKDDPDSSGSVSKGSRKKAKETDGRWSKRFTWPDELHRDFVSAVFDVGLKHSSPSTIMEHMPKHPQINSERIKSHLQKYRLHRAKSKQEFMSSYESSLKKFKAGEMDHVSSLSDGQVAAQLSHAAISGAADPQPSKPQPQQNRPPKSQQQQQQPPRVLPSINRATTATHEALMLPKLTEVEKNSPIGASMGYLLGLFFSLKKQLLMQRASDSSNPAGGERAPTAEGISTNTTNITASHPVTDVYNSFVASSSTASAVPSSMPPPAAMMDWSAHPSDPPHAPAPITANVPNPVVPPQCTGSTRNNLEASSMMKREMQNQMAFQNKMRALKQQELDKYKDVSPSNNNNNRTSSPNSNQNNNNDGGYKHDGSFADNAKQQHSTVPNQQHGNGQSGQTHHNSHDSNDKRTGDGEEQAQGSGDGESAAAAGARTASFSIGGTDDFWNTSDVMDEQLFEFLMNN
jgi:SHAQKYF class myb-like DNA-binding protein